MEVGGRREEGGWEGEGRRCGIEVGEEEGRSGACGEKMENRPRGGGGK